MDGQDAGSETIDVTRTHQTTSALRPVRSRALILGVILALVFCAVTPFNNILRQATPLGGGHFPLAPFFALVWLTLLVALARKVFRTHTIMTGQELLIAWGLMLLTSGIAYTGLVRTFFINITAPYHFATTENRWADVLQPLVPASLYPGDSEAVDMLYNGLHAGRDMDWLTILAQIPWHAWIKPLLIWGGFILLFYFVMICTINIISRQALDNERMNFPLLRVPLIMEAALDQNRLGHFFSNRFMLAGLSIPVFLHLLNGLHFYFPAVPQIPTLILAGNYFPNTGIFSGFIRLKIYIYPAFIGFAFLASKQVSLSFWLFFLLGGLLVGILGVFGYNIPASALGTTFGPTIRNPEEMQMIGAFLVFFLFLLWLARRHFANVLRQAFFVREVSGDDEDWISNRFAFWGVVAGGTALVLWLRYFNISLVPAVFVLLAFFMFTLVAGRVICQGGVAYFTLTAAPLDGILAVFGSQFFTHAALMLSAVIQKMLFLDLRESIMPSLLHARKLTEKVNARKRIFWVALFTLISGVAVSMTAMLALCYKYGLRTLPMEWASRTTLSVYEKVQTLVETPMSPNPWILTFAAVGVAVMLLLVVCYHRIYWWPLHPIGYLTAYSSAMQILWISFFIGWLCNALCIRYGGVILFKKVRYFFIGLIIGDFFMGGFWAICGLFSYASYQVLPT